MTNKYICIVTALRYIPPIKENLLQESFHPNEARKSVFAGKLFLFFDKKQASSGGSLMYTRKNAQVVTNLFTSCQQVVFALLVPSLL